MLNPNIQLTRAIGSEFITRKIRELLIVGVLIAVVTFGIMTWLISLSWWWLLLAVPTGLFFFVIGLLFGLFSLIIHKLKPQLSVSQNSGVRAFVDKLERVAETIQTPVFIIMFRVVKDTIWPKQNGFIKQIADDSSSLSSDFAKLQKLFV